MKNNPLPRLDDNTELSSHLQSSCALEIDRCRVEKDQIEAAEQIVPPRKELLLEKIFYASWRKRCGARLLMLW